MRPAGVFFFFFLKTPHICVLIECGITAAQEQKLGDLELREY